MPVKTKKGKGRGRPTLAERGEVVYETQDEREKRLDQLLKLPPPVKVEDAPVDNDLARADVDPWEGLTPRQKMIQTMKIQGLSLKAMAGALGVHITTIVNELKAIKVVHAQNGAAINAEEYVGEVSALHSTVEQEAWLVVAKEKQKGNNSMVLQALQLVLTARSSRHKLLSDIGLVQKRPEEINHNIKGVVSHQHNHTNPMLESLSAEQKQAFANKLIEFQLSDLDEPTPDDNCLEAEYEEVKSDGDSTKPDSEV